MRKQLRKGRRILKIAVMKIPEEGLNLCFSQEGDDWFSELVKDAGKLDFSIRALDVSCRVAKVREKVFIEGSVETLLNQECCRCLEMAQVPVRTTFSYVLIPEHLASRWSQELEEGQADFGYYDEEQIDLNPLLFEQIILQIPMKVLCMDACRGLCPGCGVNLNVTECDCRKESADERLSVLKKLKTAVQTY
jgi:uncharacterized protein